MTTFNVDPAASPEQWCEGIVGTLEEHHREFSHHPPVPELEVYGASPTAALSAALAEFGFDDIGVTRDGFRARSRPAS